MSKGKVILCWILAICMAFGVAAVTTGCSDSNKTADGRTIVNIISYKQEAVDAMQAIQDKFNAEHDDIYLQIDSPYEAVTVIKTRLIRDDYPDIIAIGGDMTYQNFLKADLFMNLQDLPAISEVKPVYMEMLNTLKLIPVEGVYGLPYVANAAGILFNVDIFNEYGWEIPETWDEFIALCEQIEAESDILPLYSGYKDTWTTLAPWNSIAASLAPNDAAMLVNSGEATYAELYKRVAEEEKALLEYAQPDPVAYGYNDACTAFANGESAMYVIGNYAIPQILSVNPDMNIDSFVFPAMDVAEENILCSGIDLMFCALEANADKRDAIYEVLDFLYEDATIDLYLEDQGGIACKEGDFAIPETLHSMREAIDEGRMADYQDHHYPTELTADALIQTYLLDNSSNATETFLDNFDTQWVRYNRDTIADLEAYYAEHGGA